MKKTFLLLLCFISSLAFADTSDVEQLLYSGINQVEELNLSTEKTRTEYRTVRVPSTCYRTEYRRQCTSRPPQCRTVCNRRGICQNRCTSGGRVCRNVPVQVRYTCMRNETRAYQVHDYDVETNVKFVFNTNEVSDTVRENFSMRMTGENASLTVNGSKNYFLILDNRSRTESRRTGVKYVNLIYKVSLIPARSARNVLANGIQNVKLANGILSFNLGAGFNFNRFTQKIRIFQNRRLGTDPLLLNKYLSSNDMNVQSSANASNVTIDLNSLGVNLPSKMRVMLDTNYVIDSSKILNKGEIKTEASANWVFR